jgi:hypothetical protein
VPLTDPLFKPSLNVNVHFHSLFIDGVYIIPKNRDSSPKFQKINYPTDDEINELSENISITIITKLQKQGYMQKFKFNDQLRESLPLSQIKFAELMKKTLNVDIEVCPKCGGKMRIIAFVTSTQEVQRL